jgi:hypothetical protein
MDARTEIGNSIAPPMTVIPPTATQSTRARPA